MASLICFDIDCSMQNLACRLELANASAKGQHAANLRGSSRLFSFRFVFFLICLFVCFAKKTGFYSESTKGEGNCHFGSCFCNQSLDFLSCLLAENNNEMSS